MTEREPERPAIFEAPVPYPPMTVRIEAIAEACHEVNRVIQKEQRASGISVAPPWYLVSAEMKSSVMEGVVGILAGKTPAESHEAWCEFKREHGWTYGEVKDENARTHPCLVPYKDLPPDQKLKDQVFQAVVMGLAQAFGSVI